MPKYGSPVRFAFVTHNTTDFSQAGANEKIPHLDIADLCSKIKSRYYINLAEVLTGESSTSEVFHIDQTAESPA